MKKPLHIAVTTQKGGAGKSTLTVHLASSLQYIYGYKVMVIDCDYPQHTISSYRNSDIALASRGGKIVQQMQQQNIVPYPVLSSPVDRVLALVDAELEKNPVDVILYDLQGSINREGLPELLLSLDYLFVPIEPDKGTIASAMSFLSMINDLRNTYQSNVQGVVTFWNKYNRSEKADLYSRIEKLFGNKGFDMMQTRIAQLVIYRNDRSTLLPLASKDYERLTISTFIRELLTTIAGGKVTTPSGHELLPLPEPGEENSEGTDELLPLLPSDEVDKEPTA